MGRRFCGRLTVVLLEPFAVLWHHWLVLEKPSFTVITPISCRTAVENGKRRRLKTPPQPTLKYVSCAIMQLLGICWCRLTARVDFPPLVILKDRTGLTTPFIVPMKHCLQFTIIFCYFKEKKKSHCKIMVKCFYKWSQQTFILLKTTWDGHVSVSLIINQYVGQIVVQHSVNRKGQSHTENENYWE